LIWPEWGVLKGFASECNSAPMPEVYWIAWYLFVRTHVFIPTVWFWRQRREASFFVAIM
jgi:hypothetical protein